MIAEFTVENFLSIKTAQTLSFIPSSDNFMLDEYCYEIKEGVRLLKIGIIYGANASGKSNLFSALGFFKELVIEMPKDRNEGATAIPFLLDNTSSKTSTKMSMIFYINHSKYILSFVLNGKYIESETLKVFNSHQPTTLYQRRYDADSDSTIIDFGAGLKLSKKSQNIILGNTINNASVIAAFGKSNVEKSNLNEVYDYFSEQIVNSLSPNMSLSHFVKRHLEQDENGKLKKFILKFLKASDFNIEDISIEQEKEGIKSELVFTHRAGDYLCKMSEGWESNGTIRFLGMVVLLNLLLENKKIIAIDEVETSLHYELLSYFIKVFLANSDDSSQMLLTTHDINLLNEEFIRRDAIWFTDKNEDGATELLRLSSLGLHKNISPYNAYKQGKLGKLPFLGSQYLNL